MASDRLPKLTNRMQRYPPTTDRSLTVFSSADRLLIEWANQAASPTTETLVVHDRFGGVALSLAGPVRFVSTYHSQETALSLNVTTQEVPVTRVLDTLPLFTRAVLRLPKSLSLLDFYLHRLSTVARPGAALAIAFMTRHFTPRVLEIAGRYAERVTQTRARQKARLLILEDVRDGGGEEPPPNTVSYGSRTYRQLPGVFSAQGVDRATAFLLEHWPEMAPPATILDVACGNGIIGDQLLQRYPTARLMATDDSLLAVHSARMNLDPGRSTIWFDHTLRPIPAASQDLVVTNPPFHFGHENNIDVTLGLFRQSRECLRPGGNLVVVANRHLNYATHLRRLFGSVEAVADSGKFVIYRCTAVS